MLADVELFTVHLETDSRLLSNACRLNSPPMIRMTTYDKIVTTSLLSQPESLVTVSNPLIACWQQRDVTTCDIKSIATRAEALQLTIQDGFLHAVNIDKRCSLASYIFRVVIPAISKYGEKGHLRYDKPRPDLRHGTG